MRCELVHQCGGLGRRIISLATIPALCGLLVSCGSGSGSPGPAPRFVAAMHGSADLLSGLPSCPDYIDFSIFLEAGGTGQVSLEHPDLGSHTIGITWYEGSNGSVVVDSPGFSVDGLFVDDPYYRAEIGWRDLTLRIEDADRDGTAETGEASATIFCIEYDFHGDDFEDDVYFDLEAGGNSVALRIEGSKGDEPLYTWADELTVRSTQPLLAESVGAIALLADGVAIPATVEPLDPSGLLCDGVTLDPIGDVPFAAALSIDAGTATDGFGTAAQFDGDEVHTVADPGPLTDNPSFETTGGWIGLHTTPSDGNFTAPDGERYGYVGGYGDLIGYVDVPANASTLSFYVGVFEDLSSCPNGWDLFVSAATHLPVDIEDVEPQDCNDCVFGQLIPWHKWTWDVTSARGSRVVVHAIGATYTECAPDLYPELELDNFRIE